MESKLRKKKKFNWDTFGLGFGIGMCIGQLLITILHEIFLTNPQ